MSTNDPNSSSPPPEEIESARQTLKEEVSAIYNAHAAEIGRVAIAWNRLHEDLGLLFSIIVAPERPNVALAAWHAVRADRNLRDMLVAAAAERFPVEKNEKGEIVSDPRLPKEIKLLMGKATGLEEDRNNFVHAPYEIYISDDSMLRFGPASTMGNVRASRLNEKTLVNDLQFAEWKIDAIRDCAFDLMKCLGEPNDSPSWPEIPTLRRSQFDNQRDRRNARQQPESPPRSSPE